MNKELIRTIIIDGALILMTGYYIYVALDEMTNGETSRQLSLFLIRSKGAFKEKVKFEQGIRKSIGRVIWQAWGAIDPSVDDSIGNEGIS